MANDYTLGRGKVYFARFQTGTQVPDAFLPIGNVPEFSFTIESETLDHFSSEGGIREKDDSVPLEVTRTGSFTTDNINMDNLSMFYFGSKSTVTQASATSVDEDFANVIPGAAYQLGVTAANPVGKRGIDQTGFAVNSDPAGTTYDEGDDYTMDYATGMLTIVAGGAIDLGDDITVSYAVDASTRERVVSGSTPVEGALRYIANNPKGTNRDVIFSYVKITPNGDFSLIGEEWQTIPFSFEALKPSTAEAVYIDGRPTLS